MGVEGCDGAPEPLQLRLNAALLLGEVLDALLLLRQVLSQLLRLLTVLPRLALLLGYLQPQLREEGRLRAMRRCSLTADHPQQGTLVGKSSWSLPPQTVRF